MRIKFIILVFITGMSAKSGVIDAKDIVSSVEKNYPTIMNAQLEVEARENDLLSSSGGFDSYLDLNADKRLNGYYDGENYSAKVVKPFRNLNSKIYLGYEKSQGIFPSYEGKLDTLSNGEVLIGMEVSLLRNRFMHQKQFKEELSKLKVESSKNSLEIVKQNIKHDALITYWNWVIAGKVYQVYDQLLSVSESRGSALVKKFKLGDLARIRITENQQYISERRSQKEKAKLIFDNLSQELAMFYRDNNGKPILLNSGNVPSISFDHQGLLKLIKSVNVSSERLFNNPKFRNLDLKIKQFDSAMAFEKNKLLPNLDLKIEATKDYGVGPNSLQGSENRLMINFQVPIERNLGKGALTRERTRKKQVEIKQVFQRDQILVKDKILKDKVSALKQIILNTNNEVSFAEKLLDAENKLFFNGSSDFFVLNMREQKLAKAKIKQLSSYLKFKETIISQMLLYWDL